jgi:adenosylcobinamide-phosphate synthase
MTGPTDLALAFIIDLAIGDPRWLPHPVRMFGAAINKTEVFLRQGLRSPKEERTAGIMLALMIVIPVYIITYIAVKTILWGSHGIFVPIGTILLAYTTSTTLALRELIKSARLVIESVKDNSISAARNNLAMIVGRDTEGLSKEGVLRATIETLAENLSDGVIAPLFYLVIGGLPLAMAYKAVNTLDSMVGYKNERYLNFGMASAKLDDIANYIPARISGSLIVISSFLIHRFTDSPIHPYASIRIMRRDGKRHSSPNSGIPEAAMAGALGIRLGGTSTYAGVAVEKPFIGDEAEGKDYLKASEDTITIVKLASLLGLAIAVAVLALKAVVMA